MDCDDCGFAFGSLAPGDLPGALGYLGPAFAARVDPAATPGDRLRRRPAPGVWSALEYACHVRDVLLVQRERAIRVLVEDGPSFPPMYREQRVALAGYAAEQPAAVATGLTVAADLMALLAAGLTADQLGRRCTYNFPEPTERDLLWLVRHTVHEGRHHLADVDRVLAAAAG